MIKFTWRKTMTVVKIEDVKLNDEERQPCEVWTRVMGYLRPVSEFNKGKKSEFYTRKYFAEGKAGGGQKATGSYGRPGGL